MKQLLLTLWDRLDGNKTALGAGMLLGVLAFYRWGLLTQAQAGELALVAFGVLGVGVTHKAHKRRKRSKAE